MESIEISVDLVSEGVTFESVVWEENTERGYGKFGDSYWADGTWDEETIGPGIVSNFIEWNTHQGDYPDTYSEEATFEISQIEIKDLKKYVDKNIVPPEDATVVIPEGGISITVDLGYDVVTYQYCSNPYCEYLGGDPDVAGEYPTASSDGHVNGAYEGDTLTIVPFEKTVSILDIGDDYFTYGVDYGSQWYKVGDEKTFDDYVLKVLDINIFEQKVLLQLSEVGGEPVIRSVKVGDTTKLGGLYVTVEDAFIGATQDVIAKLSVKVEEGKVVSGSEKYSLAPGYVTHLDIKEDSAGYKYIDKITFVNSEPIEGETIDIFNTYEIDYVYTAKEVNCVKGDDEFTKYLVNAEVVIDPYPYYIYETLEVGDEVGAADNEHTGWIVDAITAEKYTQVTPGEAKPITVLDTEIMEAGLESVDSNLILVGGPVVNSVAAALAEKLEIPTDYDGWESEYGTGADSGVIKYIAEVSDINGYGVVLVAGTDREGTQAAAEALMEYLAGL
nr:S-layer protein [Thermococcus pacificus]